MRPLPQAALALLLLALPARAGEGGVDPGPDFVPDKAVEAGVDFVPATAATPLLVGRAADADGAARIAAELGDAFAFCSAIADRTYVADCVGAYVEWVAERLPATGDYAAMRDTLADAARRIDAIVEQSRDPARPRGVARSTGPAPREAPRPLRPVTPAAAEPAVAAVAAVVEDAQLTLLLSADEGSPTRSLAFQEVATSLDEGITLLLSA